VDIRKTHFTELFENFAGEQQGLLRGIRREERRTAIRSLDLLLCRYPRESDAAMVRKALRDPYFPLGMLERTVFADVDGMRFFINKRRPDLEPVLRDELREWSRAFLRIRADIETYFDKTPSTCIPLDGFRHQLPSGQWCSLCGVCCQIGGVPPLPPPGIRYPDHWSTYLAGGAVNNQQLCPFLFQYFGEDRFFCAIHHIKPLGCQDFGEEACRQRLAGRGLHCQRRIQAI